MSFLALKRFQWNHQICCCVAIGLVGLFPFFATPEEPQQALSSFVNMFLAQDAGAVLNILHTDIVADKDVRVNDVDAFLKRFPARSLQFKEAVIEERFKSEDGKTDRIRSTLRFTGPVLAPQYPDRSVLNLTLLWVMEDNKWWLERPLKIDYTVNTTVGLPNTAARRISAAFFGDSCDSG